MRTLTSVLLVLLCGSALAGKDKARLSGADEKKYKAALNKGRQLEAKKKYGDAMTSFEQALAIAKDDATVLTEMGWTEYLAADYDKAEQYTRRALANEATPNIRGAAFYNLGLVQEKRGDRAGAGASYKASLEARWNATVRAALVKLDPAAAAALDPFKPQAMAGPFKSLADYCKPFRRKGTADDPQDCECGRDDKPPPTPAQKPFEAFDWVKRVCSIENTEIAQTNFDVAVKVGGSWYVAPLAETDTNFHCDDSVTSQGARIEAGRVVFRLAEEGGCMGGGRNSSFTEDQLTVVAIGASGKPSATPPIVVVRHEEQGDVDDEGMPGPTKPTVDVKLEVTWSKDGLELKGKTKGGDASLVGKHSLAFP